MRSYFSIGTKICTDHHQEYNIENFHSQQGLQSYDPETGEYYNGIVGSVDYERVFNYIKITCDDQTICVSDNQKFRVGNDWLMAKDLKIGDYLKKMEKDSTISKKEITNIEKIEEIIEVYGFINVLPMNIFFANRFMVMGSEIIL